MLFFQAKDTTELSSVGFFVFLDKCIKSEASRAKNSDCSDSSPMASAGTKTSGHCRGVIIMKSNLSFYCSRPGPAEAGH